VWHGIGRSRAQGGQEDSSHRVIGGLCLCGRRRRDYAILGSQRVRRKHSTSPRGQRNATKEGEGSVERSRSWCDVGRTQPYWLSDRQQPRMIALWPAGEGDIPPCRRTEMRG